MSIDTSNLIGNMTSSSATLNQSHQSSSLKFVYPNCKDKYKLEEVIGAGATAYVQAALCTENKERVAIKRINLEKCNTSMEELFKEIQVMSQCHHENVVTYYTSFVVGEELWLVMRLLDGGSLLDILKFRMKNMITRSGVLDEASIATILREVLKGLEYFHANGHIHRDIKAGNILLGLDGSIQISDFGVSAFIATGGDMTRDKVKHTFVGTPCWMAPEVMEQKPSGYDTKADIWSLGITAIELAVGTAPYHKYPPMKVLMMTLQNDPPTLDMCAEEKDQYKNYSKTFRKMIAECLRKDPNERPTAKQLLKHEFFKKAKDKSYIAKHLALPAEARNMKVKTKLPVPAVAASGRWIKGADGEWGFDFDDDVPKTKTSDDDDEYEADNAVTYTDNMNNRNQQPNLGDVAKTMSSSNTNKGSIASQPSHVQSGSSSPAKPKNITSINLVLRMRDEKKELQDIKFEFLPNKDTVDEISHELVNAKLIDAIDMIAVSANLNKILENHALSPITFPLKSGVGPNEIPDEKTLIGYAQLSISHVATA
ncbi:serine threonine- kinase OSR1 isoform X2 [Brachionus plicatilis]|uniref:non-specific serine/threonine protein kinase n=1 Tax=Brachionus plicatilis TaxID=10195 RepID=A0A3M7RXD1_BRAPC|nr:serine threonine- kinase OSR1 isoform X2 [Brachionus plicatilis]